MTIIPLNFVPVKIESRDDLKAAYGATLRMFRHEAGLSQMELAARAKMHFTYLGDSERGERNISLVNIVRLARALDVPLDQFFARFENNLARK